MINSGPITGTTYGDVPLPEGQYTYHLRAIDTFGLESGPSEPATASFAVSSSSGCFVSVARNAQPFRDIGGFVVLSFSVLGALAATALRNGGKP